MGQTWSRNVNVAADASGNISDSFNLPDWFVATYKVTATGAQSGVATTSFTDGNITINSSGPSFNYTWTKFNGNSTCTGLGNDSGTKVSGSGAAGVNDGQSLRVVVPATAGSPAQTFTGWSGAASGSSTTVCIAGTSGSQTATANYSATRATTTTLARTAGANPSTYGDGLAFTATVTASAGNPSSVGTVTFKDSATTLCSNVALSGNQATCSTSTLGAGSHSITAAYSGTSSGSPQFGTSISSALSQNVNKAPLTVKADDKSREYGDSNPDFTVSYSGFKNGENSTVLTGGPVVNTPATQGSDVGTYPIVPFPGSLSAANYSFIFQPGTLTITAAPITIKANDASRDYGDPNPNFGHTVVAGTFKNNDDTNGGVSVDLSTTATQSSPVATYDIVPSLLGPKTGNYDVTAQNGTLTILGWTFKGFYQPVDMNNTLNTVKGGSTVPIKVELFKGDSEPTDTANVKQPQQAQKVNCTTLAGATEDTIELTATGGTSLRYDTTGGQFIYNWKTPTGAGTCYKVTITANDGSSQTAYFKLT